ncbi:MAG: V-type ATP synthase subunit E [Coriobacteriia bacterium]
MAIEDIFRALEEQADAECAELIHIAETQAASISEEARLEADKIKQRKMDAIADIVRSKAGKTLNAARLENKKELAAVRDEAVEKVFSTAASAMAGVRSTSRYEGVFKALAQEALAGVDGECTVLVDPADTALAEKTLKSMNVDCTVSPTISTIGGLVVSTVGGRVMRRNTFEARLAKARSLAQAQVAGILTR